MATPPRKDLKKRRTAPVGGKPVQKGGKATARTGSRPGTRSGSQVGGKPRGGAKPHAGGKPRTGAAPRGPRTAEPSWPDEPFRAEEREEAPSAPVKSATRNYTKRLTGAAAHGPRAAAGARPGTKPGVKAGAKPGGRPGSTGAAKPRAKAPAKPAKPAQPGERLQKILAAAGVDSRRACEEIILAGRVQVNGVTVTELGSRADVHRDEITLDFQPITRESPVYLLLNKPKGYVTSVKDDRGRPTVMALIHGLEARVYPVGRLDFNSEGLLLLTNDGELAQRLMAPEFHVPKVYLIKVHRMPKPETLNEFREGFRLDGQWLKPCGIEIAEKADNPWLKVTLIEGKNQQLRRMFAAVGHPISKLRRVQFGPLEDPALKPGEWRFLNPQELAALKNL